MRVSQSFVPWFTDQVNLDVSGSHSRQGLLGLASPSAKHMPSMLHVLSWQPEAAEHHPETERRRATCVVLFNGTVKTEFIFKMWASPRTHTLPNRASLASTSAVLSRLFTCGLQDVHKEPARFICSLALKAASCCMMGKITLF